MGIRAGKGACEKPSPQPGHGRPHAHGSGFCGRGRVSLQGHLCPSVPSPRPPGGPVSPSDRCCSVRCRAGMEGTPRCPAVPLLGTPAHVLGPNPSRHPVAPRTAPWALHPRCHPLKKRPLAAHTTPSTRKGRQGQFKPGTRREVKSPRGKGRGLLSDATHLLGTMQGVNTGSPGVTLHPRGPPGADVTLGRAARGRSCRCPVQLPGCIFSLRRVLSP